jgi:3-dehydroquinate dehydratase
MEAPQSYQTRLVQAAKKQGIKVIVSHHNYEVAEASSQGLEAVVTECFEKGADVAKLAVAVCSPAGAARVLSLYQQQVDQKHAVVSTKYYMFSLQSHKLVTVQLLNCFNISSLGTH